MLVRSLGAAAIFMLSTTSLGAQAPAPWPSRTAWVRWDTVSNVPNQGLLLGPFASTFEEACAAKTPYSTFPRGGYASLKEKNCATGQQAYNLTLAPGR
jgi:hypothetical protein